MSSQPAERMTSRSRVPLAIGIVVLSLVLPFAVVCWSVLAEIRDKEIAGAPSKRTRTYEGSVQNGELWHAETWKSSKLNAPPVESHILRLDLKTGVERDTGLVIPGESGWTFSIDGELYFQSQTAIFRQSEHGFVKLAAMPARAAIFSASVFMFEGRLTTIQQQNADGGYRLVHLADQTWIDGRPILLPEPGRVWHDDPQRGRLVLLPRTSQPKTPVAIPPAFRFVFVVQQRQQHHIMLSDFVQFAAYRTGFEFADEPHEGASALAPENAARDVSGWEPIGPTKPHATLWWLQMNGCRDGLLFNSFGGRSDIVRRNADGTWDAITRLQRRRLQLDWVAGDSAAAAAYVIGGDQQWGSAEVSRIEGNIVHPPHLVVRGVEREYLHRWKRLSVSLLFAWWLHAALLIGGAAWLSRGATRAEFEFGNKRSTLASFWRRAVATSIDAVLIFSAVGGFWRWSFEFLGVAPPVFEERTRAEFLFQMEQQLAPCFAGDFGLLLRNITNFIPQFIGLFGISMAVTGVIVAALVVIGVAKAIFEGRYGVTPGKWLLGLRTVRTTLCPCGFARALVRNLFYYVDLPLFLTPLPAAISLMLSEHRQRIGDRAADTLVIRARSIREAAST